jgi:hypothetical protein
MIPVLILGGLVVGRWWVVLVAALVWPAILAAKHIEGSVPFFLGAAALGGANAAAGVAVHRVVFKLVRIARTTSRSKPTASDSNSERP